MDKSPDYKVGYKKPPLKTRFQRGKSGNPRGRPKKTQSINEMILEELETFITIQEKGQQRTLTKCEALVKTIVNRALKGEDKASRILLGILQQQTGPIPDFVPLEDDASALEKFLGRDHAEDAQ